MKRKNYGRILSAALYCIITIFLISCKEEGTTEQQAANAALEYYNLLVEGDADEFLSKKADVDSLPADYRQLLLLAQQQYLKDMESKHQGLKSVSISKNIGRCDTLNIKDEQSEVRKEPVVYAFLLLQFKDSTQEEITVPMVQKHGEWLMK